MKKKVFLFSLIILFIDQLIKWSVLKYIDVKSVTVIGNFFSLDLVFNTGASWGLLNNTGVLLVVLSLIILAIIIKYLLSASNTRYNIISYSFLIGGLMGNLIDRVFRGYVIDYLSFNFWGYSFPVFNFADIMIVVGTILIAGSMIKGEF